MTPTGSTNINVGGIPYGTGKNKLEVIEEDKVLGEQGQKVNLSLLGET